MVQVPKIKRKKWDSKARECVLTGFEENTKGYRLYDLANKTFLKSREVTFINEGFGEKTIVTKQNPEVISLDFGSALEVDAAQEEPELVPLEPDAMEEELPRDAEVVPEDDNDDEPEAEAVLEPNTDAVVDDGVSSSSTMTNVLPPRPSSNPPGSEVLRRSGREHVLPGKYKDFRVSGKGLPVSTISQAPEDDSSDPSDYDDANDAEFGGLAAGHRDDSLAEPQTFAEAMVSPDAERWKQAMADELESIKTNETWTLVDLLPGRKAVGSKWV